MKPFIHKVINLWVLQYVDVMRLWVRAAGVEDVQYSQVPCFPMELPASEVHTLCVPCETWTYAMCILSRYSTAVVSSTTRTECNLIKCFILALC